MPTPQSFPASSFSIFPRPFPTLYLPVKLTPQLSPSLPVTSYLTGLPIVYPLICLFHCPLCLFQGCLPVQSPVPSRSPLERNTCWDPLGAFQLLLWVSTSSPPGAGRIRHRWAPGYVPSRPPYGRGTALSLQNQRRSGASVSGRNSRSREPRGKRVHVTERGGRSDSRPRAKDPAGEGGVETTWRTIGFGRATGWDSSNGLRYSTEIRGSPPYKC